MKQNEVYTCKDYDCHKNSNGFCTSNECAECKRDPKFDKQKG